MEDGWGEDMGRHSLRALLLIALLIPLAWAGIALIAKQHGSGGMMALIVLWAVGVVADVSFAIWSMTQGRRARLERRPEGANSTHAR
jgi:uncharacterized protein (DUF58 family)